MLDIYVRVYVWKLYILTNIRFLILGVMKKKSIFFLN